MILSVQNKPHTWKVISKSIQSRDMLQPRQCMSLSFCRFRLSSCHNPNTDSVAATVVVTWSVVWFAQIQLKFACRLWICLYIFSFASFNPKYWIVNLFSVWSTVSSRKLSMCTAVFFVWFPSRLFIDQINRCTCHCFTCLSLLWSLLMLCEFLIA